MARDAMNPGGANGHRPFRHKRTIAPDRAAAAMRCGRPRIGTASDPTEGQFRRWIKQPAGCTRLRRRRLPQPGAKWLRSRHRPNLSCWAVPILTTRSCAFCQVEKGPGSGSLRWPKRPTRWPKRVDTLKLRYVVLTAVRVRDTWPPPAPDPVHRQCAYGGRHPQIANRRCSPLILGPAIGRRGRLSAALATAPGRSPWRQSGLLQHNIEDGARLQGQVGAVRCHLLPFLWDWLRPAGQLAPAHPTQIRA